MNGLTCSGSGCSPSAIMIWPTYVPVPRSVGYGVVESEVVGGCSLHHFLEVR